MARGAFPDSRFLHYNLGRTGRMLTGADYARVVAQKPDGTLDGAVKAGWDLKQNQKV